MRALELVRAVPPALSSAVSPVASRVADAVVPRLEVLDASPSLLREGYLFGTRRFARLGTDAFETRLMLRKALFAYGEEAAQHFYTPDRLTRKGALPLPSLGLLQDLGSALVLDGEQHRVRKAMWLSLMTPAALDELADLFEQHWPAQVERASGAHEVVLLDLAHEVLCRAICEWSGVPLPEEDVPQRTRQFVAMHEGAGAFGPRNWRGQLLRSPTERWARGLVQQVRDGRLAVADGRALQVMSEHRDADGELLDVGTAAVELINVLRPTVSVARFVVFAALALHEQPDLRGRIAGDDDLVRCMAQEVRRYYPFFPLVGGRVQDEFDWRGTRWRRGDWLLLDLYASNHDARIWGDPQQFRPDRFSGWRGSPFSLIPQGGGDYATTHRCPGEAPVLRLLDRAVRLLAIATTYEVPPQDLAVDLTRMPAAPRSCFVVRDLRLS